MVIAFACECGRILHARDEHVGKRAKCPACGRVAVVPGAEPEAAESAPASFRRKTGTTGAETPDSYALQPAQPGDDLLKHDVEAMKTATGDGQSWDDRSPLGVNRSPPPLPTAPAIKVPPARVPESEPWCYAFLDRYARATTRAVLGTAAAIVVIGTVVYFWHLYSSLSLLRQFRAGFWDLLWSSGVITLYYATGVALFLLLLVVPVLFALALVHVIVDVGRNLRAIRTTLAEEE
jgi:hypothetical protein